PPGDLSARSSSVLQSLRLWGLEQPSLGVHRRAQRAKVGFELSPFRCGEVQRVDLAAPCRRGRRAVVVLDHLREGGDLAGVHVWRALRYPAQGGRLVGSGELCGLGIEKLQLRAILGLRVAVATPAVEL